MISHKLWPEWLQGSLHHYLSQCHGSSCCACKGGTSVNVLPRSGIAVGTYGVESLSCPDTGERLNSKCWVSGMPRSSEPPGQLGKEVEILPGTKCALCECVCARVCGTQLRDSVGVQELNFSQRGNQWPANFMCSQDNVKGKTEKISLST